MLVYEKYGVGNLGISEGLTLIWWEAEVKESETPQGKEVIAAALLYCLKTGSYFSSKSKVELLQAKEL